MRFPEFFHDADGRRRRDYRRIVAEPLIQVGTVLDRLEISGRDKPLLGRCRKTARIKLDFEPLQLPRSRWRELLEDSRFEILFDEDTERAFTSELNDEKRAGMYLCAACYLPLFRSYRDRSAGRHRPADHWQRPRRGPTNFPARSPGDRADENQTHPSISLMNASMTSSGVVDSCCFAP